MQQIIFDHKQSGSSALHRTMKRITLLITLIFITGQLFSHPKDSIIYKNGIAINLESFIVNDYKLTFTHRLKKALYLETMFSYNFPSYNSFDNVLSSNESKDPYELYGRFQIRFGLKEYAMRRFYFGEMFLFNYGQFDNGYVTSLDGEGSERVSRVKHDYEFLFKMGWTVNISWFLFDFYMGLGLRYKLLDDTVFSKSLDYGNSLPKVFPYHQSSGYIMQQVHLGLQIGFCK